MEHPNRILSELHKTIELKVHNEFGDTIDALIENGNGEDEILLEIDTTTLENDLYHSFSRLKSDQKDVWATVHNSIELDGCYEDLVQNLDGNKSITTRLRALDALLSVQIIETKQESWRSLSKALQQSLLSTNAEVYKRTLKIFYRVIAFRNTCTEGYISLLKGLAQMFANRYFVNSLQIDLNNTYQKQVLQIYKVLLETQRYVLLNSQNKQKPIDDIITNFINLNCKVYNDESILNALDFLVVLDCQAGWFKNFCFALQTRNTVLQVLNKSYNLIKNILTAFLQHDQIQRETDDSGRKGIISKRRIQLLKFVHSTCFFKELFRYRQDVFPFKVKSTNETFNLNRLLLCAIANVGDDVKKPFLLAFIGEALKKNSLGFNQEVLMKLFEPFNVKSSDKRLLYESVQSNQHVFDLLIDFCGLNQKSNFLFGRSKSRRHRRAFVGSSHERWFNAASFVLNLTCNYLRFYVNHCESEPAVDEVVLKLLSCCSELNESYRILPGSNKLIVCLKDFFKAVNNYESNLSIKTRIAVKISFIIESCLNYEALDDEDFLIELSNDVFGVGSHRNNLSLFVMNIANTKAGIVAIKNNYNRLIRCHLENLWQHEGDIDELMIDADLNNFLLFMNATCCNYKAVEAFLLYDNEGTVVEGANEDSYVLSELIENCLNETNNDFITLLVIKILITNADVVLFLDTNYKLQERLNELLQNHRIVMPNSDVSSEVVVDRQTVLINNILLSVKYIGHVDRKLNEHLLKQMKLSVGTTFISSSAMLKRHKHQNELHKFLQDFKGGLHDHSWVLQARRAFKSTSMYPYKGTVLIDLIEQVPKSVVYRTSNLMWPPHDSVSYKLFPEDFAGISTIVRFGVQFGYLHSTVQNEDNLMLLLKQSRTFLNYTPEQFEGFDWFVGMAFLICAGSVDKSKSFLCAVTNLQIVPILWRMCGKQFDMPIGANFFQNLTAVLDEIGIVNAALKEIGLSAEHICKRWFDQCFFNVLCFHEICNFVAICALYPPEFVVFYTIALFEQLRDDILSCASDVNFQNITDLAQIDGFRLADRWTFIETLSKQYRHVLKI